MGTFSYVEWKRLVNLPYDDKVTWSRQLIGFALKTNDVPAVSLSWGKDSVVMLHLVLSYCKNVKVIFANTGIEYPETYKYRDLMLRDVFKDINYYETRPIKNFGECVKLYGYPDLRRTNETDHKTRTPKCCLYLKEKPLINKSNELGVTCEFIGLQTTESMNRRRLFMRLGPYYYNKTRKRYVVLPMAIWNDNDVLRYAKENNIPLNPLYSKMSRTGCMFCTGFKGWRKVMAGYNKKLYAGILLKKEGQEIIKECY